MTITSTKAWKHYMLICRSLEYNDIPYIKDDNTLCVRCRICGRDGDLQFLYSVDPSKMLINLYSPLNISFDTKNSADAALAVCLINNRLSNGFFYLDMDDRLLYFRMTTSFYETDLNGMLFEYMLSAAADTIEEYSPEIETLLCISGEGAA